MNLYFLDLMKSDKPRIKIEIQREDKNSFLDLSVEVKKKMSSSRLIRFEEGYKISKLVWVLPSQLRFQEGRR
jgi:hypothetical protein